MAKQWLDVPAALRSPMSKTRLTISGGDRHETLCIQCERFTVTASVGTREELPCPTPSGPWDADT